MYYLFTGSDHTPIIIYMKDKWGGEAAKEVLARAQKKINYVSE